MNQKDSVCVPSGVYQCCSPATSGFCFSEPIVLFLSVSKEECVPMPWSPLDTILGVSVEHASVRTEI